MSYVGQALRLLLDQAGMQYGRNTENLIPVALVDPTANVNFHEGGAGKRGGTDDLITVTQVYPVRGIYQVKQKSGTNQLVYAKSDGKIYKTNDSTTLKTGMSTSNYFHFSMFNDQAFICDGATKPQFWDGSAGSTSDLTAYPTDWSGSDYPFMMIPHARGANARGWYIRADAVYASKNGDAKSCGDSDVKKIPVYTEGGITGAVDFGGTLFVFSKTKTYIIDDTDTDVANWGYYEAPWTGGVAHWRLICPAGNNVYLMTEEGIIYSIQAVNTYKDFEQVNLTRPAHIDRYFQDKVDLANINEFHSVYDPTLRCVNWFVDVGGSHVNTNLKYFIDRDPQIAWIPHNNLSYSSGLDASASCLYRISAGVYKIYTGDFSGQLWKHEQTTKTDNGNAYQFDIKLKPHDMDNPIMYKHFRDFRIRAKSSGNFTMTVKIWVDGVRKEDKSITISGTGALFGSAIFGTSVFAASGFATTTIPLGYYGYQIEIEVINSTASEDMFVNEIFVSFKNLGSRPA